MNATTLTIGATYYGLTFADRDLTMPGVEPLVFLGEVELAEGGRAAAFQDTVSYVRFGARLGATEDIEEVRVYFIPSEELGSGIVTIEQAAGEVAGAARRAAALGHPVLPVLRGGWRRAL